MAEGVKNLRVGDPMSDQTQVGPLVDKQGLDKVASHVDDALGKPLTFNASAGTESFPYAGTDADDLFSL